MTYLEFRDRVLSALEKYPSGLTWKELKMEASLPYSQPCYEWLARLEKEIGLERKERKGNALIWRL